MELRKITSLTLLLSFVILVLTSIVLYIVPEGRVAYWSDWRLLWLSKTQWGDIHTNSGFLFLAAGLLWGLVTAQWNVVVFFLLCVVVAALYGAWSVSRRIFYVQGVPAIAALAAIWLL